MSIATGCLLTPLHGHFDCFGHRSPDHRVHFLALLPLAYRRCRLSFSQIAHPTSIVLPQLLAEGPLAALAFFLLPYPSPLSAISSAYSPVLCAAYHGFPPPASRAPRFARYGGLERLKM